MPTDQFDGSDRLSKMSPLSHLVWIHEAARRFRARLVRVWNGMRKQSSFYDFNDHMLADIGLRRDGLRGLRSPDPWLIPHQPRWKVDPLSRQGGSHGSAS